MGVKLRIRLASPTTRAPVAHARLMRDGKTDAGRSTCRVLLDGMAHSDLLTAQNLFYCAPPVRG